MEEERERTARAAMSTPHLQRRTVKFANA